MYVTVPRPAVFLPGGHEAACGQAASSGLCEHVPWGHPANRCGWNTPCAPSPAGCPRIWPRVCGSRAGLNVRDAGGRSRRGLLPGCVSPSGRVSSPSVTGVSHSTCSAAPAGPLSGPGVDGGLLSGVTRGPGEEASEQTASLSLFSAFAGLCSLHGSGVLTGGFSSLWAGAPPCTAMWGHPQRRGGSLSREENLA